MEPRRSPADNGHILDTLASYLGLCREELQGFIIVGIRTDNDYEFISNAGTREASMYLMADALAIYLRQLADDSVELKAL